MSEAANVDLELSGEEYDRLSDEAGPPRYLFLCTTPRTGSHRLSRAMYELGLAFPAEYLHPWAFERLAERWCAEADPATPEGFEIYWSNVCRWRNRDGIVACAAFGYRSRRSGRSSARAQGICSSISTGRHAAIRWPA